MSLDLEKMKGDIEAHLNQLALPIFYAYSRLVGTHTPVYWDVDRYPDFRAFIECGKQSGARVYVFHHHAFALDQIHEALDTLEDSDLSREEKRSFEVRLRELQAYEGFTCALELSYDVDGRTYLFEVRTEWYEALTDVLSEIDAITEDEDDDSSDPIAGYFSKN